MTAILPNLRSSKNAVPLTVEEATEALSNHRRRVTIRFVSDAEAAVHVDDLANHLAGIENDAPLDAQDRKRVYISLTQTHLDTLDELDAITYDERQKIVSPNDSTHGLSELLRDIESVCNT